MATNQAPSDPFVQRAIDRLATYVAKDGRAFESLFMQQELANNPESEFQCLTQSSSPEALYYRWKVPMPTQHHENVAHKPTHLQTLTHAHGAR